MYAIRYSSEAAKTINRLPVNLRRLIAEKVKSLAVAPHDRQPQVKALKGEFKGRGGCASGLVGCFMRSTMNGGRCP